MVKKNQLESRALSGSNVTPISKASQAKANPDEGLPISGLPAAVDLTEEDYFPVVQKITAGGEETRRATMEQIKTLIPAGPKGDKGQQGEQGPKGDKGDPGPEEITLSPGSGQRNLLERQADGYKVDALRPIIPKFSLTAKTIKVSNVAKTLGAGAILYRMENKIVNQLRYKSLGGAGVPVHVMTAMQQYFFDREGKVITVQANSVIKETAADYITVVTTVIMSGTPTQAFSLLDDSPYPSTGDLDKFSVWLYTIIGSTLEQNGIE